MHDTNGTPNAILKAANANDWKTDSNLIRYSKQILQDEETKLKLKTYLKHWKKDLQNV